MRFQKLLLCLIFSVFFCSSFAQESQELLELLSSIHTLKSNFSQIVLDNNGHQLQKARGKLYLRRPGQFRWEVSQPIPQLIIARETKIWIYDPDLQQVVIRPLMKAAGQTPAFLLSNISKAVNDDFVVQRMAAPRYWEWYSLKPKSNNSLYTVIQLGFFQRELKEMRLQDSLGHRTVIQFDQIEKNIALSPSVFTFKIPPQVDVIDETH